MEAVKKIEHYVLPEHTNKLYVDEAISSINLTKDVADKINEIVDTLNGISEWNLTKHQEQDGAIRKGIIYMKDNLLNSLHDLLELYKQDGTVITMIQDFIDDYMEKFYEYLQGYNTVTPQMFGAKGDGVNDDTQAIKDAFESSTNVYFPAGVYSITDPLLFDVYVNIKGSGMNNTKIVYTSFLNGSFITATHKDGIQISDITIECISNDYAVNGVMVARGGTSKPQWGGKFVGENVRIKGFSKAQLFIYAPFQSIGVNMLFDGTGFKQNGENHNLCDGESVGVAMIGYEYDKIDTFGNVNKFDNCFFSNCKYGIHITSCVGNEFNNCVFEPNFINIYLPHTKGPNGDRTRVRLVNCWLEDYTKQSHPLYGAYCIYDIDESTGLIKEPRPELTSRLELVNTTIHSSCKEDLTMGVTNNFLMGTTRMSFDEAVESNKPFIQVNSNDGSIINVSGKESFFLGQLASRQGFKLYNTLNYYSNAGEDIRLYTYNVENPNDDKTTEFSFVVPHRYKYTEPTETVIDVYLKCTGGFTCWYRVQMCGLIVKSVELMNDEGGFARDIDSSHKGVKVEEADDRHVKITMKAYNCEYARVDVKRRVVTE